MATFHVVRIRRLTSAANPDTDDDPEWSDGVAAVEREATQDDLHTYASCAMMEALAAPNKSAYVQYVAGGMVPNDANNQKGPVYFSEETLAELEPKSEWSLYVACKGEMKGLYAVGIGRFASERLQAAHISFALGSIQATQAAHKRIAMGDNVRWLMENCEQFHQSEWDMAADLKFRFADIGDDDDSSDEAPLALVTPHQPCSNSHCTFAATVQHRPFCCMQCGKAVKSNRKLSIHGVKCLKKPALRNRDQDRRSRSPRPRKMPKELKEPKKELKEPKPGPAQPPFPPNLRQGLHRGSGKASNTPPPTRGGHDRGSDAHEKASRVHRKLKSEPTEDDDRGRSQARAEAKPVMPLKREAGDAGAALAAHKRGREELLCKMSESHDFLGIAKNLNSDNGFGFASNKLVIDMLHKDLWFCLFDSPRGSAKLENGDLITFKAVIGQDSRIKATNINLVMPTWQEVRWLHLPHRMIPGLSLHLPILWELHCGNLVAAVAVVSSGRFTNDSHNGAPMGAAMWRCRDGAMAQRCFLCFPNYGPTGLFILRTSSSGAFVSLD